MGQETAAPNRKCGIRMLNTLAAFDDNAGYNSWGDSVRRGG